MPHSGSHYSHGRTHPYRYSGWSGYGSSYPYGYYGTYPYGIYNTPVVVQTVDDQPEKPQDVSNNTFMYISITLAVLLFILLLFFAMRSNSSYRTINSKSYRS